MQLDWGTLRRTEPVSRQFGYDRGRPVDRYYIERFLANNSDCIRGRVLEIGDDTYTRQFGGERVHRADTFHAHAGSPSATFVGDLATDEAIPPDIFDCAIVTQTLQFIRDPVAALRTLHRILKPGAVLLLTAPGLTPVSAETDEWSRMWYWSFTAASIRHMTELVFGPDATAMEIHGNVLACTCILEGIAVEDVSTAELDPFDPAYPVLFTVRAEKRSR
jgi:SAM-dependent methyltransferase